MDLEEFETQYREFLDYTLNELQTATLLLSLATTTVNEVGTSVQALSQKVEAFIRQQKSQTVGAEEATEEIVQIKEELVNQQKMLNLKKDLSELCLKQLIKKLAEQQQNEQE